MVTIRQAELHDIAICERFAHDPILRFPNGGYPDSEFLKDHLGSKYFLVAEVDGKVGGWVLGERLRAHGSALWFFIIGEPYRKQGVDTKLYNEFEKFLKKDGREWVFLTSHINHTNLKEFYLENGFVQGEPHFEMAKKL